MAVGAILGGDEGALARQSPEDGPGRWVLVALGAVGLALAAFEVIASTHGPFGLSQPVLVSQVSVRVLVGLSFIGAGLVGWARRPQNRVGIGMVLAGFSWFIGAFGWLANPVAFSLSNALSDLFLVVLAYLFLIFPTGRLRSRRDRALIIAIAIYFPIGTVIGHLFLDLQEQGCDMCPRNVLMIRSDPNLHALITMLNTFVTVILAVLVLALVVSRWRGATGPARRVLQPAIWASWPAVLVVLALSLTGGVALSVVGSVALLALGVLPVAFLIGLLRTRLDRSAVSDLVLELSRPLPHGRLREVLARALKDPSLQLAFWLPESHGFVDADGRPVSIPPTDAEGRAISVLESEGGVPLAALIHDETLTEDPGLVESVGTAARLALENERLQAQVRAQLEEVRASRARIVEAADEARRRMERDLHDGAQQRLLTVALALTAAQAKAGSDMDPELRALIREAAEGLKLSLAELRELARGMLPAILTDGGLAPALEALARRSPVPARVLAAPSGRLPLPLEVTAYFLVSEALTNVARHAQAAEARIRAECRDGRLVVEIVDDGVGGADASGGSGLRGLLDRVSALGGTLRLESPAGMGTCVAAEIPYEEGGGWSARDSGLRVGYPSASPSS